MSGLLHHPSIYAYIHKHHHRSVYPFRGNVDARNEHPIEQLQLGPTIKFARQATYADPWKTTQYVFRVVSEYTN